MARRRRFDELSGQAGASLVSVLVAAGILGIVVLIGASLSRYVTESRMRLQSEETRRELLSRFGRFLNDPRALSQTLKSPANDDLRRHRTLAPPKAVTAPAPLEVRDAQGRVVVPRVGSDDDASGLYFDLRGKQTTRQASAWHVVAKWEGTVRNSYKTTLHVDPAGAGNDHLPVPPKSASLTVTDRGRDVQCFAVQSGPKSGTCPLCGGVAAVAAASVQGYAAPGTPSPTVSLASQETRLEVECPVGSVLTSVTGVYGCCSTNWKSYAKPDPARPNRVGECAQVEGFCPWTKCLAKTPGTQLSCVATCCRFAGGT